MLKYFVYFFLGLFFLSFSSQAEYRAFLLKITSADGTSFREVISTLDPWQYVGYFPLATGESIQYTRTWKCMGRTNDRPICPAPEAGAPNFDTNSAAPPPAAAPAQPPPISTNPAPAPEIPAAKP